MAMLVLHAADHVRHLVEGAKRCWPVRDGEARIIAGDQGSGHDQDEGDAGCEDGKTVQPAMVRNFDALQNGPRQIWSSNVQRALRQTLKHVILADVQRRLSHKAQADDLPLTQTFRSTAGLADSIA